MNEFHATDYDAYIVGVICMALRKSFSLAWTGQEDSKLFYDLVDQGNSACIEDYYCEIFGGKTFTRFHKYVFTLLLLLEHHKVLRCRFSNWFSDTRSLAEPVIISLSSSEQNVEPVPELLGDFIQPCDRLTYPEKIVLAHQEGVKWENFLLCLQQPTEKCDFDLFYAFGLLNVLGDREEIKALVCQMCIESLLENNGALLHTSLFMEVVNALCANEPVSYLEVSLLLHLTHRIEQYFSTDSLNFNDYSFLNGVVLVLNKILLLMVNRTTAIAQVLHQSSISEIQKVPPVYTIQYHVAHASLLVCERIWDQQLANVRPLISLTRLLLCLSETFDILTDVSTMERELACISSTLELILEQNVIKGPLEPGERKELESMRLRVSHSLNSIHRPEQ
ncbi:hydrolase [Perkinsela sp. CCAP 1560/4]|nr:hydrolase [Perkinsela sp. CCAP 1560/4]|eukprot:KNH09635.1 hydrolase [Perkinsela sp. CCAP 1560/4]